MQTKWIIPGTTLEGLRSEADRAEALFGPMFLAGGLTLSQVASITGLETHTIQNWVKRKFLAPPKNKRYDKEQVCRIILINMLKGAMTLEQICSMISSINGDLTDESDDIIDDALLYFMFVRLAARARHIGGTKEWGEAIAEITEDYQEPYPGAKDKVIQVLRITLTAWVTTQLRAQVDRMVEQLQNL
jgi:DNA-binding transcriptional MerR regulator